MDIDAFDIPVRSYHVMCMMKSRIQHSRVKRTAANIYGYNFCSQLVSSKIQENCKWLVQYNHRHMTWNGLETGLFPAISLNHSHLAGKLCINGQVE